MATGLSSAGSRRLQELRFGGSKSARAFLRQSRLNADMKAANILVAALLVITTVLTFNQWRLQRALAALSERPSEMADAAAAWSRRGRSWNSRGTN
jgi:hypothetical protein